METIFMAKARGLWCLPSWPPVGWPTRFLGPFWDVLGRQREKNRGETKWVRRWNLGEPWGFRFIFLTRGKLGGLEALAHTAVGFYTIQLEQTSSYSTLKPSYQKTKVSQIRYQKKKNASENVPKCVGANDGKSTLHLQAFLVFRCFPHLRGPPRSCRNVSGGRNALWSARRGTFFRGFFGAEVKKNGRFHWWFSWLRRESYGTVSLNKRWWFSQGEGNYSRAGLKCLLEDFGTFAILTQGYWRERGKQNLGRTEQSFERDFPARDPKMGW